MGNDHPLVPIATLIIVGHEQDIILAQINRFLPDIPMVGFYSLLIFFFVELKI